MGKPSHRSLARLVIGCLLVAASCGGSAFDVCSDVAATGSFGDAIVRRAETVSADAVVAWQEGRHLPEAAAESRYRGEVAALTVCLIWGEVATPAGPPVGGTKAPPHDAVIVIVDDQGNWRIDSGGYRDSLVELPSDFAARSG